MGNTQARLCQSSDHNTTLINVKPLQSNDAKLDKTKQGAAAEVSVPQNTRKRQSTFIGAMKQKIGFIATPSAKVLPMSRHEKIAAASTVTPPRHTSSTQAPQTHAKSRALASHQRRKRFSIATVTGTDKKRRTRVSSLKNEYYVQRLAFNIFAQGKAKISVSDLARFFHEHTNDDVSYEDIREMLHRACNDYELTFDDFRRILAHDEDQFALGRASLPGALEPIDVMYDTEALDRQHIVEARKLSYGIYKPHYSRSFTSHRQESAVAAPRLDLIVQDVQRSVDTKTFKRSISQSAALNAVERDYFELRQAFTVFDQQQYGEIDASDMKRVMNQMNLRVRSSQISDLFQAVGKNKKDALTFSEFVKLYRICQSQC